MTADAKTPQPEESRRDLRQSRNATAEELSPVAKTVPLASPMTAPTSPFAGLSRWGQDPASTCPTAPESPVDPSWPLIEGFEIRSRLGGDGQGDVYCARDCELQVDVAIKVPKSLNGEAQDQFLREARALAKLEHRNIVGIRRFGRSDESVYFVMDLIAGPNAGRLVRIFRDGKAHKLDAAAILTLASVDPSRMPPDVQAAVSSSQPYYRLVAEWVAQAADGLHAAHQANIYHRDVKPSNFILSPDGRMMVADFGLARSSEEVSRSDGLGVTGTYPYIAPERALGEWARVDHRADIWALGATLYEFLAFQRAYPRGGREVLKDIVSKEPAPPRQIVSSVPHTLEEICLKAMRRDPDDRYATAAAMAAALRTWARADDQRSPVRRRALVVVACVAILMATTILHPTVRAKTVEWIVATADSLFPKPPPAVPALAEIMVSPRAVELTDASPVTVQVAGVYSDRQERYIDVGYCHFTFQGAATLLDADSLSRGKLVARQNGQGTLRAHYDGFTAECAVTIRLAQNSGAAGNPSRHAGGALTSQAASAAEPSVVERAKPRVLLACNEDLNADDSAPARAGGTAERVFRAVLGAGNLELKDPIQTPPRWDERLALQQAEELGADYVVFCSTSARVVEHVPKLEYVDYETDRWELVVNARVFYRNATGQWGPEQVPHEYTDTEVRPRGTQYSGDGIVELARDAANATAETTRALRNSGSPR